MDGSRTHRGPLNGPPPVLKTGEPTGTQPLPTAKDTAGGMIWQVGCLGSGYYPGRMPGGTQKPPRWTKLSRMIEDMSRIIPTAMMA